MSHAWSTVAIFGAGATKAHGGPLTNEILPQAFEHRSEIESEDYLALLERFLIENFHLPVYQSERTAEHYPALPLLLSLVDKAIDHRHAFAATWDTSQMELVRDALEYTTFALLEYELRRAPTSAYYDFLSRAWPPSGDEPTVISLNYDIIADNTLVNLSEERGRLGFADYGCDIATAFYQESGKFGRLFKLHGSMNWIFCPACARLDLGIARSGRTVKALARFWPDAELESKYSRRRTECGDCKARVRPIMITPTHRKDYRNPHISQVWYHSERVLRAADRVIIVGYSLPPEDVDVAYLLKRSLSALDPRRITVIELDDQHRRIRDHPVGQRYAQLFGSEVDWHTEGFNDWVWQNQSAFA